MADVQVTSARLEDGTLTVTGSGFTQTTTVVEVDGNEVEFTVNDERTEITVENVPAEASEVDVTKGGNTSSLVIQKAQPEPTQSEDQSSSEEGGSGEPYDPGGDVHKEGYKTQDANQTPGDLVEDDLKTTSDVDPQQLNRDSYERDFQATQANQPDRTPLKEGEHLPGKDFRSRVENTAAGDLNWDPRKPYPKGNAPDPRESFYRIHGYYPPDENAQPAEAEQAAQMDADPKT